MQPASPEQPPELTAATSPNEDKTGLNDPLPLAVRQSPLWMWATPVLSIIILGVVAWNFRSLRFEDLWAAVPSNPLFWVVFAAYYSTGIVGDFIIFRWLWKIPFEGLIALARKNVTNELVVDYLGEAYFYGWARRKVKMETSPFGAVKDVAILSALVSNCFTLVMMALAYPYAREFNLGVTGSAFSISIGIVMIISILVVAFGKRLFSLPRKQLWAISGIHLLRLFTVNLLLGIAWSLALPNVALGWWLVLATAKMLLSRLPLFSNRDIVFAGVAVLLVGDDTQIEILMALIASLILLTHLALGAVLAIGDLVTIRLKPRQKSV